MNDHRYFHCMYACHRLRSLLEIPLFPSTQRYEPCLRPEPGYCPPVTWSLAGSYRVVVYPVDVDGAEMLVVANELVIASMLEGGGAYVLSAAGGP